MQRLVWVKLLPAAMDSLKTGPTKNPGKQTPIININTNPSG